MARYSSDTYPSRVTRSYAEPSTDAPPCLSDRDRSIWPDTAVARQAIDDMIRTLNMALLSSDSATLTLENWCRRLGLSGFSDMLVAARLYGEERPVTPEQRALLGIPQGEPILYRHVRLHCGAHILSEAENWYIPARLTPDMNAALDKSDVAFGRAVQTLRFHRRTLTSEILWTPMAQAADSGTDSARRLLTIPTELIRHEAILLLQDETPFSLVRETYTNAILGYPPSDTRGRTEVPYF